MRGNKLLENLTIFTTIDSNYADSSLVCLHSFRKYHTYPVQVYCLNFSDSVFEAYKKNTAKIKDVYPVKWNMKNVNIDCYNWNTCYAKILPQISAKFDILNTIPTDWILYFDTDTLFINSVTGIFDSPNELNGVCFSETNIEVNCGLFLLKNKNIDWLNEYLNFCRKCGSNRFSLDEGFLGRLYANKIKVLPKEYNTTGYYPINSNTIMVHYIGNIKPFSIAADYNLVCIDFAKHFKLWYDYYDTAKSVFNFSNNFNDTVNQIRNTKFDTLKIANSHLETKLFLNLGEAGTKLVIQKMIADYKRKK